MGIGNSNGGSGINLYSSMNNYIYANQITGFEVFSYSSNNTVEANTFAPVLIVSQVLNSTVEAGLVFGASNNNLFTLNNFYGALSLDLTRIKYVGD